MRANSGAHDEVEENKENKVNKENEENEEQKEEIETTEKLEQSKKKSKYAHKGLRRRAVQKRERSEDDKGQEEEELESPLAAIRSRPGGMDIRAEQPRSFLEGGDLFGTNFEKIDISRDVSRYWTKCRAAERCKRMYIGIR